MPTRSARQRLGRSVRRQGKAAAKRSAKRFAKRHPSVPVMILGATVTAWLTLALVELAVNVLTITGWVAASVLAAVVVATARGLANHPPRLPRAGSCSSECRHATSPVSACSCSCAGSRHGAGARR